jgi:tetratricopeptide (TPR) repeat protein
MRLFFLISILVAIGALAGCSGAGTANTNTAGSEQQMQAEGVAYTDANQALQDGIKLLDTGETDRAIDVLNQAVALNPDLAEAYFHLGIAYSLVEARDADIIENDTNVDRTATEKDRKEKKKNSEIAFRRAVDGFKKVVAANKEDHSAWFNMGRAYNKLNEDKDALEAFEKAVELNPEDTDYQTALGEILIKLARYREAIAPLKKAIEIDPGNAEAMELLEDAEAGRSRINYQTTPTPKPDNKNSSTNTSGANSNSQMANASSTPSAGNVSKTPPATPRPSPNRTPRTNE